MIRKILYIILIGLGVCLLFLTLRAIVRTPSNDRDWESGFSPLTSVEINGDEVTLYNVRDWRYNEDETLSWDYVTRTINANEIERVWYLISKPNIDAIDGHVFFTFDFKNADPLVLSIEARREKGESFNPLLGIFREFEIIYMWGTEEDFLIMRPVLYDKDVVMYPIDTNEEDAKILFMDLINTTASLEAEPDWYNTLIHNCTNTFYQHVNKLAPGTIPFRITQWAVGLSDKTIMNLGYFESDIRDLDELRNRYYVSEYVRDHYTDEDFSEGLREFLGTEPQRPEEISSGIYGNFSVNNTGCQYRLGQKDEGCSTVLTEATDLYFFNTSNYASNKVTTNSLGNFVIELDSGNYYVYPNTAWVAGYIDSACLENINNCTSEDRDRLVQFINTGRKATTNCSTDQEYWPGEGKEPCMIVVNDDVVKLKMQIDDVQG